MVFVVAIILGFWVAVMFGVVVLCRAAHQLDQEIERDAAEAELASFRLPFAS